MKKTTLSFGVSLAVLALTGCGSDSPDPSSKTDHVDPITPRSWTPPGGMATVSFNEDFPFLQFTPGIDLSELPTVSQGRELFVADWVAAPGPRPLLDGLGPLAITDACSNCHLNAGRAASLNADGSTGHGILFRLGNEVGEPDPIYGGQLQTFATAGLPEGQVQWQDNGFGKPIFSLTPAGQAVSTATNLGPRLSPQLVGVGLLELIDDFQIQQHADPDDANGDGISGRVHWRDNGENVGRFGWKAMQATLRGQTAAALQQDMGLTSPVRPDENCTDQQSICTDELDGGDPEVSEKSLNAINDFLLLLAVPDRRIDDQATFDRGANLFDSVGCAGCHRPTSVTTDSDNFPQLGQQIIYPYTDLLLHDMGEELADGVREGDASSREWRTPPLWSLGLIEQVDGSRFLHDGRATTIEQAIIWHGGEAQLVKERFTQLNDSDRADLLSFLRSI